MRSNLKASFAASLVLLQAGTAMAQSAVTLTARPTTTTLPDGQTVPMWGYSCGPTTSATCAPMNAGSQAGSDWQPPLITVPSGQPLTITLINNLTFATSGVNVPTSLVIDGQLGGGLGTQRTTAPSPKHDTQGTTWPGTLGTTNPDDAMFTPPQPQPDRVRSLATEVPAGATSGVTSGVPALTWNNLRPGTYLLHSGTQPSIQHPMGLYGVLVVTEPDDTSSGQPVHQAYGTTFDSYVALLLSEIDPAQNVAVDVAVRTAGFDDTKVWSGRPGMCGDPTVHTCYPPVVNYTPLYHLVNGVSFDRNNGGLSALAVPAAGAQGRVLLRLVNAGLRMHVPSVVGASMTLRAEDGNKLPGVPRVQSEVFLAAGKTYDVTIPPKPATPGTYAAATYAVFDRALSLSTGNQRDGGMQAYLNVAGGAPPPSGTATANPDTYYVVSGVPLTVSDPAKGVIANDVGIYGVAISGAPPAGLTLDANGTFTYTGAPTTFTYCGNGATSGAACTTVTLADCTTAGTCMAAAPIAGNAPFPSKVSTRYASTPPGVLGYAISPGGLPLTALPSGAASGGTVSLNADGSFVAVKGAGTACPAFASAPAGATCVTFGYQARNSQGTTSAAPGSPNAAVVFPAASNLVVNVKDAKTGVAIGDYRWIIEEDRTFFMDPRCQINSTDPGIRPSTCPPLPVEALGYSFHTSSMPVVAQGCVGTISCESGQTLGGAPAVCDIGNGVCRTDGAQKVSVSPSEVHLDPTKRYYLSILPGDGVNANGGTVNIDPDCKGADCPQRQFDIAKDCGPYTGPIDAWEPGGDKALCGHAMGGAQIAAGQTTVDVRLQQTPLPTAKIAVFVFQDDNPLNGENDAGGLADTTPAPNEPGLGGFELKLFDQAGALGDPTGQITYDMFNMPVSNALAGTLDPVTGKDACPITSRTDGLVGMIPTCPKYESDGVTLSPLAGQAVIANLYPGLYEIVATPGADRIARGEEWLQTNTLDGTKPHEAFIKPDEPAYFQEFGPGGFHVSIGFANPQTINNRRKNAAKTGICDPKPSGGGLDCTGHTLNVQVTSARMSRTPDQRIYPSGSPKDPNDPTSVATAYTAYGFSQCYLALGPPDGADFALAKCDPDGLATFTDVPLGDWRLTIFDQWNELVLDGLVQPVHVDGDTAPKLFAATQWRSNIYTRTFIDTNGDGVSQGEEPGLALVNTNIRYRDGSIGFFNNTDLDGYAGFNEVFPFMNWLVVETSSTRFKQTGTHVVYDAGGPADNTIGGGSSTIAANLANTIERVSPPPSQRVPGAVYCADADCSVASIATGAGNTTGACTTNPTTGIQACTGLSTGRIDPAMPWGPTEAWQGLLGQNSFVEFGMTPFQEGENGGISGHVIYASTRPFDDPALLLQLSWEPGVPLVNVNLYRKTVDAYGNEQLKLVDTTKTTSWDEWAQGFRADGVPNMNCPGQDPTSPFFATLRDSKQWLDATPKTPLPNHSLFKCFDGWSMLNQIQPAPYDGMYKFPSVTGISPTTGKPTGTHCDPAVCVDNPSGDGTKMLPPGKYVVEIVVPPGYELVKEEDKNILLGDAYIAPVTQQFAGFGNIFIMPDQAAVNASYSPNNPGGLDNTTNQGVRPRHEGDTGSIEAFWPCAGAERIVPDLNSLFPGAGQAAPFAGAKRRLCDRKEVLLQDQASVLAKFYIFSSTHIAGHFTGTITNDFAAEFDPFSPQFGEKFGPPNLPVAMRDFSGNEVSRVYADQWGMYNGLYFSSYGVNPPNPTGYVPQMSIACMNDPGPLADGTRDPAYNPAYSNFCYEWPFMPGTTAYMDTPVIPTQAFADQYNLPDCEYPNTTPAIQSVTSSDAPGPWVSASGGGHTLTITALGTKDVPNPAYSGPSAATAPYNQKTIKRHYGFGNSRGTVALVGADGVSHPLTGVSWNDGTITGGVPANVPLCSASNPSYRGANASARCGELVITAANGERSIDTVTVTIGGKAPTHVTPQSATSTTFGQAFPNPLQTAIDRAAPGDLIIVGPGTYRENLLMWKPVRLQGVGAASVTINADAHPAGKMDPWRRQINCLFGLALNGRPLLNDGTFPAQTYDPSGTYQCPASMQQRVDRIAFEAIVGWDATGNGNLAQQLQEPTLMGAYEGAGITVVGRGVRIPANTTDFWGASNAGGFPDGYAYLSTSSADCAASTTRTDGRDYGTSNFLCNPSRIDGLSVINSSQGGGAIFAHAWNHHLEVANNRVSANHGTLTGGITIGTGEFPDPAIVGGDTPPVANQPASGLIDGQQAGYGFNRFVKVHHNSVSDNASIGDALYSGTPSAAGGVTFSSGADNYELNHNWVCGNLSSGDGAGVAHSGFSNDGNISNNWILYNQSTNPTLPTNGGGLAVLGAAPDRTITLPDGTVTECGATTDQDCPPGLSEGTGRNLVIDANLIIGNSAESGSGGGIRFQAVNGQEVPAFPTRPDRWYGASVTNNVIANNVAGWDGGGVSMQDALKLVIVNNTIVSNDTTASAGVLFKTIGSAFAAVPPPGCDPGTDPSASCYGPDAPVHDQPAGLVTMQHSPNLIAELPAAAPGQGNGLNCPTFTPATLGNPYSAVDDGDCRLYSKPLLVNNLFWRNRAFHIQVVGPGSDLQSQQNLVTLVPTLNQTATGQCANGATYWDVGVRGDTSSTSSTNIFGGPANPTLSLNSSILTSFSGRYNNNGNRAPGTSPVRSVICNGSRVPPENGGHGYNVPAGQSETTGLHDRFTLNNISPAATVDEGKNWINLSYGPLALFDVAEQALLADASVGPVLGAYSIPSGSDAINHANSQARLAAPTASSDFFGTSRGNNDWDIGAVEFRSSNVAVAVVTPSSLSFGGVAVGQTSTTQNLTLTNSGGAQLTGITVAVSAPFSRNIGGSFPAGAPNCGPSLAAGASCTIKVQYAAPSPAGTASTGTVTISGSVGVTNSPVSLSGYSVAPAIAVGP